MLTRYLLTIIIAIGFTVPGFAQAPWQFRWQKGQTLTYKIQHVTSVVEIVQKTTNMASSRLDLVNRWQVGEVDSKGVATLTLTLVSLRNEQKLASGETLLFDSKDKEKSTPKLREQMQKYIGQKVTEVRIDGFGRVLEVKQGSAATLEVEPPFLVVFPAAKAAAGQAWRRAFNVVLDPPYGTGEKFPAEQRYECKKLEAGKATLGVTSHFKALPDNPRERIPLAQKDVQGELVYDLNAGRLISARLTIDKTIENHQGKESSYHFKSDYSRQLVE